MNTVRTAYGIRYLNQIDYVDRSQLVADLNSLLSIRNPDSVDFYNKLRKLADEELKKIQ